jgi:hypothetical protein
MSAFLYCLRARDMDTRELVACWSYKDYWEAVDNMDEFIARFGWMPNINIRIVQK